MSFESIFNRSQSSFGRAEFIDYLRQAVGSIVSHKLRSFLSMTGILIGVAAVISMLALGEGAKISISQSLSSLGSNVLVVRPAAHRHMGVRYEAGSITRLTENDASELARITSVAGVSPTVVDRCQLVFRNKNWNTLVMGVSVDYPRIRSAEPVNGRFFTEKETRTRSKVVVMGSTVVRELFGQANPVGRTIKINRINFTVIGILPTKGVTFRDQDDLVVIPLNTAMFRVMGKNYVDYIDVQARSQEEIDSVMTSIQKILSRRHRVAPGAEEPFRIRDLSEIRNALTSTTRTMGVLLGVVAAISLLVGGIGIMNIMLVSVKERVKEIGLRKAIGARRRDIRLQFLIESVLLTFSGGITGIILGVGISVLINVMAGWSVMISVFSIILSTAVSVAIGIAFGFWPAVQASKLDPIEALRYE